MNGSLKWVEGVSFLRRLVALGSGGRHPNRLHRDMLRNFELMSMLKHRNTLQKQNQLKNIHQTLPNLIPNKSGPLNLQSSST